MPPCPGTSYVAHNNIAEKINGLGVAIVSSELDASSIVFGNMALISDTGDKTSGMIKTCCDQKIAASSCHGYQDGIVSCGRRQSEERRQKVRRDSNGGSNDDKNSGRSSKGLENNSSSSGGNSGADGNGEDNDRSDDDDSYDYDEEDDDYEEEEEEVEEEEYDQEDEEENESCIEHKKPKRDIAKLEGEKDIVAERRCQELRTIKVASVSGSLSLVNDSSVKGVQSGLKSTQSSNENNLAPAQPGTPVVLEGVICHETMGGVLVVNIKWRNKTYCGSLIDCSRHAWATPRFEENSCANESSNSSRKGGKGKRLRNNPLSSVSHNKGSNTSHATPLKHKLRGRKRCLVNTNSKGPGLRGKKKSRNNDDESDDGVRPGKRSCTLKSRGVSPQPSPTLIECPEPNCNKKYKHINGLRYHQAHAHLEPRSPQEETNPSDQSASASPSPIEEFKEPETKSTGRWKSSTRSGVRSRSISPFTPLTTSSGSVSEKNTTISVQAGKASKGNLENGGTRAVKNRKSPSFAAGEQTEGAVVSERSEVQRTELEKVIKEEVPEVKREQCSAEKQENIASFKEEINTDKTKLQVKIEPKSEASAEDMSCNKPSETCKENKTTSQVLDLNLIKKESVPEPEKAAETEEVVWETVIDSGRGIQGGPDGVNIEDAIDVGQEENIVNMRKGASLLGIEVEDISENEEEIDPGEDGSYANKDGFHPIERQRELQYLPLVAEQKENTNIRDRLMPYEFDSISTASSLKPSDSNEQQNEVYMNFNLCSNQYNSPVRIVKPKGQRPPIPQTSVVTKSEQFIQKDDKSMEESAKNDKQFSETSDVVSIESLVAKSMSRSALEPPLTNADSPADRYKSYKYHSYGDETYSSSAREQRGRNDHITTLAPVRQLEHVSKSQTQPSGDEATCSWKDTVSGSTSSNLSSSLKTDPHEGNWSESPFNVATRSSPQKSLIRNSFHSSTAAVSSSSLTSYSSSNTSAHLNVTTSSHGTQHRMSPKLLPKVIDTDGTTQGESVTIRSGLSPHRKSPFQKSSVTLEQSTKLGTKRPIDGSTTFVASEQETCQVSDSKGKARMFSDNTIKTKDSRHSKVAETAIPDIVLTPHTPDPNLDIHALSVQGTPTSKDDEPRHTLKTSPQLFSRQLPTLIPRHGRLAAPSLPVGVARPYHHSNMEQELIAGTTSGNTVNQERSSQPVALGADSSVGEMEKIKLSKKPGEDRSQELLIGEVLPVGARRNMPAIHAGLPSVVPATAHALNTRSSPGLSALHSSHKGLKPSSQEDLVKQEAKQEPSGKEAPSYSSRLVASDCREGPDNEKKPSKTSTSDGNSTVGTRTSVGQFSEEQLRALQQQMEVQQLYQQLAQSNFSMEMASQLFKMYPQVQMLKEHQLKQEREKDRPVGKSLESKKGIQSELEYRDKQKSYESEQLNRLESLGPTRASKVAIEDNKKEPCVSHSGGSQEQRQSTAAHQTAQHSTEGARKGVHRTSYEEPPEKKLKAEYQRSEESLELELERQKYRRQEELLQKESWKQKISMYRQLENNLQQKQHLTKKHHIGGPEMKDSQLAEIDEDLADVKAVRREGPHATTQREKPAKSLGLPSKHHYGGVSTESPDDHLKRDSQSPRRLTPYESNPRPNSLNLSGSPRLSRSPGISHHKDTLGVEGRGGERSASAPVPSNFIPSNKFQAYLQQLPAMAQLPFDPAVGARIHPQAFLPGVMMGVPFMSSGSATDTSTSTSSSLSRVSQEEAASPRRAAIRSQSPLPTVTASRDRSPRPVGGRGSSPGSNSRHHGSQDMSAVSRDRSPRPDGRHHGAVSRDRSPRPDGHRGAVSRNRSPRPVGAGGLSPNTDSRNHGTQDVSDVSRDRSPRPVGTRGASPGSDGRHHGSQDLSARSRARSPRPKGGEFLEKEHAKLLAMQETRFTSGSPQNMRHFSSSREGTPTKSPSDSRSLQRAGIISSNLIVRGGDTARTSTISRSQVEEEMTRKQRTGADFGDPAQSSLGYIVYPELLEQSPYSAGLLAGASRPRPSGAGPYPEKRK